MSSIRSRVTGAAMCVAATGMLFGVVSTPAHAETIFTYYLTQDGSGGTLGGNLTLPSDYGTVTVQNDGANLKFDVELAPNWNVDTGSHDAVAFDLSTGGLTISGLNFPYVQVTSGLPVTNEGSFSGPFNYAIDCNGPGNGQNSCGTTKSNGDLATSLIFEVDGGAGLLPILEGTGAAAAYITVDIYSFATGGTGTVGANTFTTTTTQLTTPLPATLPLFLSGAGLIGFLSWRKKQQKAGAVA